MQFNKNLLIGVCAIVVIILVICYIFYYKSNNSMSYNYDVEGTMENMKNMESLENQDEYSVQNVNEQNVTGQNVNEQNVDGQNVNNLTNGSVNETMVGDSSTCYPKDQLTPQELLPQDYSSTWAKCNPQGAGSLDGKNFLDAGWHVGINTVGQTLRNANLQLRSEPPAPQVVVSPWNQTSIQPDTNRRYFEIGSC